MGSYSLSADVPGSDMSRHESATSFLRDFKLTEHNRSYTVTNTTQRDISMGRLAQKAS